MLFFAALVAVVSFFIGLTRWLGAVVLLCLVSSAWFLAWPETVGTAEVRDSALVFAMLLGGVATGVAVRILSDRARKADAGR
jgi:hypothetical protein